MTTLHHQFHHSFFLLQLHQFHNCKTLVCLTDFNMQAAKLEQSENICDFAVNFCGINDEEIWKLD